MCAEQRGQTQPKSQQGQSSGDTAWSWGHSSKHLYGESLRTLLASAVDSKDKRGDRWLPCYRQLTCECFASAYLRHGTKPDLVYSAQCKSGMVDCFCPVWLTNKIGSKKGWIQNQHQSLADQGVKSGFSWPLPQCTRHQSSLCLQGLITL